MAKNIRGDIKKATGREKLQVRETEDIEAFFELNRMVFQRQGIKVPYSLEFVKNLDRAAAANEARRIFIAEDEQGRSHAGVYLVWDDCSSYYLMGGSDPALRSSGANSLCLWEAIKFSSTVSASFDFEGSMLQPIERFFAGFGGTQKPYHSISHTPGPLFRVAMLARELFRG